MRWPVAEGRLGAHCTKQRTIFRVYAPLAETVSVLLYKKPTDIRRKEVPMNADADGTHSATINGDWHGWFYLYLVNEQVAVTDPYSVSLSMNSTRSAVIDLSRTNPTGWEEHKRPANKPQDAIIYELHVKDFTGDISSGGAYRGKYLGLTEVGTKFDGAATGLDHLSELGVTHVHLLPINDFITVLEENEYFFDDNNYNWGYDPEHFNAPEGSYASDPSDPVLRIYELKKMIMALHERGLSVVLDVVYNHTFRAFDSNFEMLAPGYFHRRTPDGNFSNGSGCGNEFSSELPMGRKFILDSLKYWMEEYKIDGFRFDLMALIDTETVEQIVKETRQIFPDTLLYGEPWAALGSALDASRLTLKGTQQNRGFGIFNDEFREALRGGNDDATLGYVQGASHLKSRVETGMLGSIAYNKTHRGITAEPSESINYFNSHDNLIIADKLAITSGDEELEIPNCKLLFSMTMMSFGIPFFHAGNEFQRSKKMNHNSYNAPLSINGIRWDRKNKHTKLNHYVKDCITFRKMTGVFSRYSADQIRANVRLLQGLPDEVVGMEIAEKEDYLWILHNVGTTPYTFSFPKGTYESTMIFGEHGICHRKIFNSGFECAPKSSFVYRIRVRKDE